MGDLKLTFGGGEYWDRSLYLIDGSVKPEGIEIDYRVHEATELFRKVAQEAAFDAAEMSMSTYLALFSRDDRRFVEIPVFPSRNFRHCCMFVNTRAGIDRPEDLSGKRVGVHEYQQTAALWMRAVLKHDFGVEPEQLNWDTGGMKTPGYVERAKFDLPPGINLTVIPEDRHLEEMLDAGDLDVLLSTRRPDSLVAGEGKVRRLFEDYRAVEKDYFKRTGIFPIMHTVVVRRDVHEANPWVARSLYAAWEAVKRKSRERLLATGSLAGALPWIPAYLEEIEEVFGDRNPFAYGIEPNRKVLETLIEYLVEQGLATRKVALEELFAEEFFQPTAP